jgi:hypothetical protein
MRLIVAACCLALCAGAAPASADSAGASSGALSGTISASTHNPSVGVSWGFTVSERLHGKPSKATAYYQFLFNGKLQRTAYPHGNKNFSFTGSFHDALTFPKVAKGYPLVMRVVISSGGYTVYVPFSFKVV